MRATGKIYEADFPVRFNLRLLLNAHTYCILALDVNKEEITTSFNTELTEDVF